MKILIILILLAAPSYAQECAGVVWFSTCDPGGSCIFNQSPAVGCNNSLQQCFNCFRAGEFALTKQTDPSTQFIGTFKPYKYRGHTLQRFVVAIPGVLASRGVKAGEVISRIEGKRLTRDFFTHPLPLKGARFTVYEKGKAGAARVI